MMAIIILAVACTLVLVLIKPKWGTFLIWPILFTYPHGWWYYHAFLPLNMGVDDLFCIFLFLAVLVRRNLAGGVRPRLGYAFWTITAFTLIAIVANIAGSADVPSGLRIGYLKDIMKICVFWGLFYAIINCIDDPRDLKLQFTMFSLAAVVGGVLVILQYFYPYRMEIFAAPAVLEIVGATYGQRTSGAFMNANTAAGALGCSIMLLITALRLQQDILRKITVYGLIFILFLAVAVTRSRSGLIAICSTLVLMSFLGSGRKVAWFVIVAGLLAGLFFAQARQLYLERIQDVYDPTTGVYGRNVQGRFETWSSYLETAATKDYLLGQGFRQGIEKNKMESHSTYVSLLTVYGIGGLIWGVVSLGLFFKKALFVKRLGAPLLSTVGEGCIWAFINWAIYAGASDALSSTYGRYILFYLVVLADRASYFAAQQYPEPAGEFVQDQALGMVY